MTASAESIEKRRTSRFDLAPGARVRREDFGLLFYCRRGPRLFFLSSGPWLEPEFFGSGLGLARWLEGREIFPEEKTVRALRRACDRLVEKGVLVADSSRP